MYNVTDNGASIPQFPHHICMCKYLYSTYISIESSELDIGDDSNDFKYSWGVH
jgi:hypothetical protein